MKVDRIPNDPAALPNTVVAMSALVIWKFMPRALTTTISGENDANVRAAMHVRNRIRAAARERAG